MKLKSILGVIATILAVVLAIYFPKGDEKGGAPNAGATTDARSVDGRAGRDAPAASAQAADAATATDDAKKGLADAKKAALQTTTTPEKPAVVPTKPVASKTTETPPAATNVRRDIGFGSKQSYEDHFVKHGAEFGSITKEKYLEMAQDLRDAPVGGNILEIERDDGVISRFDKKTGGFVAFNRNKTIRTFFRPNDGVRYFQRQAEKAH